MGSLLFVLFLVAFVVGIIWYIKLEKKSEYDCDYEEQEFFAVGISVASFVALILIAIFLIVNAYDLNTAWTIDEKIEMYETENASIEQKINSIVENYMDYEAATYGKFKNENEDYMTLISLFPELKSDTLVKQEIDTYISNNQKIKELKEEKIDAMKTKWFLYFGR